jgi:hypothetical protein
MMATREEISDFTEKIEDLVYMKDTSYMDAIILYCEESGFEIELAAKLISESMKSKIRIEAEDLHYIPRSNTSKLPL